jgi:hypothetical protein
VAIFHLTTKSVSKNKGQSSKAKAAYNLRLGKYAKQEDKRFHGYSGNMPEWVGSDVRTFWAAADKFERSNGRTAREIEVALPSELSKDQQIRLAHEFTKSIVKDKHPYVLALHEGKGSNPHAHLLFSERQLDGIPRDKTQFFARAHPTRAEKGGARKDRAMIEKQWLETVRQTWQDHANRALARAGRAERVDHRSLENQGIYDRRAQVHLNPRILKMVEKGLEPKRYKDIVTDEVVYAGVVKKAKQLDTEVERTRRSLSRGKGGLEK